MSNCRFGSLEEVLRDIDFGDGGRLEVDEGVWFISKGVEGDVGVVLGEGSEEVVSGRLWIGVCAGYVRKCVS